MRASRSEIAVTDDNRFLERREVEWGGYIVNFEFVKTDLDTAIELYGDAPGETCECPHWGYLFKGELRMRWGDREEIIRPGQAYYMEPGHLAWMAAGSELLSISPVSEMRAPRNSTSRTRAVFGGVQKT